MIYFFFYYFNNVFTWKYKYTNFRVKQEIVSKPYLFRSERNPFTMEQIILANTTCTHDIILFNSTKCFFCQSWTQDFYCNQCLLDVSIFFVYKTAVLFSQSDCIDPIIISNVQSLTIYISGFTVVFHLTRHWK